MLFKILHGDESRISTDITPFHEGWAYVTTSGNFYIDMNIGTVEAPNNQRIKLNAKDAETIDGLSFDELRVFISNQDAVILAEAQLDASNKDTVILAEAQQYTDNAIANLNIPDPIDLSNYYTKAEIDAKLGDINAALDAILEMQESLLPSAPISFVVEWAGDTYNLEAIEGMTWREWCNSEYNTAEVYMTEDNMVYIGVSGLVCDGHWQTPDDVIVANATYVA